MAMWIFSRAGARGGEPAFAPGRDPRDGWRGQGRRWTRGMGLHGFLGRFSFGYLAGKTIPPPPIWFIRVRFGVWYPHTLAFPFLYLFLSSFFSPGLGLETGCCGVVFFCCLLNFWLRPHPAPPRGTTPGRRNTRGRPAATTTVPRGLHRRADRTDTVGKAEKIEVISRLRQHSLWVIELFWRDFPAR
jgi:hypothetical protein